MSVPPPPYIAVALYFSPKKLLPDSPLIHSIGAMIKMTFACFLALFSLLHTASAKDLAPFRLTGSNLAQSTRNSVHPPAGETWYAHLEGALPGVDGQKILADLHAALVDPVTGTRPIAYETFVMQADGAGKYFVSIALEPVDPSQTAALHQYLTRTEAAGVLGEPVQFQKVMMVSETARFQSGTATAGNDTGFNPDYETTRMYELPTLAAWRDFTDRAGAAYLSTRHEDFLAYLQVYFKNDPQFIRIRDHILTHDNVAALGLEPCIVLDDQRVIGWDSEGSPFFQFGYSRNCADPKFEHGVCQPASASR